MLIIENLRLALSSIKANRMRSVLTMLGIIIGISSVITIMTLGNSLTGEMNDAFSDLGTSDISVIVSRRPMEEEEAFIMEGGVIISEGGDSRRMTDEDCLTPDMIGQYTEFFKDELLAVSVTEGVGQGAARDGKNYTNISLTGVNYGALQSQRLTLKQGRYFSEREMLESSKVCIISDIAVENLFDGNTEAAIGSDIKAEINDNTYSLTVAGVYEYKEGLGDIGSLGQERRERTTTVYIPVRTAKQIGHRDNSYYSIDVVPQTGVDVDDFALRTADYFNDMFYKNNEFFYIETFSLSSVFGQLNSILTGATLGISVIAGIAILVGGIGVMNIMLVSITERTREIGTRKALGATNASIRMQFIIEAVVICLIGGIIGLLLGVGTALIALKVMKSAARVSIGSIVLSITFSSAIGIFFGYYPANKAAKMNPIDALRYE